MRFRVGVLLFLLLRGAIEAFDNSTIVVAFAANEGFQYKLLAVIERVRSMKHGRSYHLVAYDLGLKVPVACHYCWDVVPSRFSNFKSSRVVLPFTEGRGGCADMRVTTTPGRVASILLREISGSCLYSWVTSSSRTNPWLGDAMLIEVDL